MADLGPEWRGKLPPGDEDYVERILKKWRESGLVTHVEILPVDDCPFADTVDGIIYPLDKPPVLPIPGCDRVPCCGCCFTPVLDDEGGATASPAPRLIR